MSNFPELTPTTRVFVPGNLPQVYQQNISGSGVGFRRGNRKISQILSLTFDYVLEADVNAIIAHYFDRNGTYDIFDIPSALWSGYTTPPVAINGDSMWHYASEPVIQDATCNRFTVQVELETIPLENGDLIYAAGLASASPARDYILVAGGASASPVRDYVIRSTGAL